MTPPIARASSRENFARSIQAHRIVDTRSSRANNASSRMEKRPSLERTEREPAKVAYASMSRASLPPCNTTPMANWGLRINQSLQRMVLPLPTVVVMTTRSTACASLDVSTQTRPAPYQ